MKFTNDLEEANDLVGDLENAFVRVSETKLRTETVNS